MEAAPRPQSTEEHYQDLIREQGKNTNKADSEIQLKKLIEEILEHPNVNTFAEILNLPEIEQVKV